MTEQEIRAQMENSPKAVRAAGGGLMLVGLLLVAHRTYVAHVMGIPIWKGALAGVCLGMFTAFAGVRLVQRERWLWWLVLSLAIVVSAFSSLHTLAEIARAIQGARIDYIALVMTAAFAVLGVAVAKNLLCRESREYFSRPRENVTPAAPES